MAAEAGRKNSILTVLKSIVQEVNQIPRLTDGLFRLAERVKQTMGVDSCSIYLADYNSQAFVLKATDGLAPDAVELVKIGFSEGLIGLVGQREEPLNIQDAPNHPRFKHYPEVKEESYHAFLGTPIIHQRKVLGVITMQQSARRKFSEDEEAFLVTLAAQIALEPVVHSIRLPAFTLATFKRMFVVYRVHLAWQWAWGIPHMRPTHWLPGL